METKDFLRKHPLISPSSIERILEIPVGTIRLSGSRPIPDKYDALIRLLLSDYGWINGDNNDVKEPDINVKILDKPVITNVKESDNAHIVPDAKKYFVKRVNKDLILFNERKESDKFDIRADLPDGTELVIVTEIH
jgi:hypothetical protein